MLVRQKVGPDAGQIIFMEYRDAIRCIEAGTAENPETVQPAEVKTQEQKVQQAQRGRPTLRGRQIQTVKA